MKINAERVAALLKSFTQRKKVSVFGGCLTFEHQQDANYQCVLRPASFQRVINCMRPVLSNQNTVVIRPGITGVSAGLGQYSQ